MWTLVVLVGMGEVAQQGKEMMVEKDTEFGRITLLAAAGVVKVR
jgi:hypothetical protein